MRVRLTLHEGRVTDYDAPQGVEFLLNDLAVRTGYDLRPCLACPPEILPDELPIEPAKADEPASLSEGTNQLAIELSKEQENEGSQPAQVPGDDGATLQQQGEGRTDVGADAGRGEGDSPAENAQDGDSGRGEAPVPADGVQAK